MSSTQAKLEAVLRAELPVAHMVTRTYTRCTYCLLLLLQPPQE